MALSDKALLPYEYSDLPLAEPVIPILYRRRSGAAIFGSGLCKYAAIALAIYGTLVLSLQTWKALPASKPPTCNCGSSIAEAKAKNCTYDALSTSWLPPACRDDELTAEFNKAGPGENGAWAYYSDLNKTHQLGVEDLALLADGKSEADRTFYMSTEWFVAYCLFYWRKIERSQDRGTTIEKFIFDKSIAGHDTAYWHTCVDVYLSRASRDDTLAYGVSGFGDPDH